MEPSMPRFVVAPRQAAPAPRQEVPRAASEPPAAQSRHRSRFGGAAAAQRVGARTPRREGGKSGFAEKVRATAERLASPRRGRPAAGAAPESRHPSTPERQAIARLKERQREKALKQSMHAVRELASDVNSSRVVYMRYVIYSIHNISAVDTSFFVDFKLEMRLVDLTTVHKRSDRHRVFLNDENLASIPFITIANAIDAVPCEQPIITLHPADPIGIVRWEQRFRGGVRLIQELHNFPFDHQQLRIELRTEWYYRRLRPMTGSICVQQTSLAEWTLHKPLPLQCFENEAGRACAYIAIQATRRPRFYFWNVIVINFVLCTLSLTTFAFPVDAFSNRSSIVLSLLLTVMAFKFTVADLVPRVAYFTFLDLYLFLGISFVSLVLVECAIVQVISDGNLELAEGIDRAMLLAIAVVWGTLQLVLAVLVQAYYARVAPSLQPALELPDEQPVGGMHIFPRMKWRELRRRILKPSARREMSHTSRYRWLKAIRYATHIARQNRAEAQANFEDEARMADEAVLTASLNGEAMSPHSFGGSTRSANGSVGVHV